MIPAPCTRGGGQTPDLKTSGKVFYHSATAETNTLAYFKTASEAEKDMFSNCLQMFYILTELH
jgi:hypothetical protein